MSYWTDHVARIERNNAIRAKNQERYGRDIAPPESFHNPLRKSWGAGPRIEKQTAQEMAAYCRVWGIIPQGSLLANTAEYRTGPHPDSYCPRLSSKPSRSLFLPGQREMFATLTEVTQ